MCKIFSKITFSVLIVILIGGCSSPVKNDSDSDLPLRITERGSSLDDAKRRALRRAVEMRVGVLMVGERITLNQDFQERIYSYSGGFIKDYKQISTEKRDGFIFATFDIWVKDSAVADGLLKYQPSSVSLQGKKLLEIIGSRDVQRESGTILLARILEGWPHNAVKASVTSYRINYELDRSVILILQGINISWNPSFEKSLRETLEKVSVKPTGNQQYYSINWNQNYSANEYVFRDNLIVRAWVRDSFEFFKGKFYLIGDKGQMHAIKSAFGSRIPHLSIELRDNRRNRLDQFCVHLGDMDTREFSTRYENWTEIPSVPRFISNLRIILDRSYIDKLHDIEVSIVSRSACSKRR